MSQIAENARRALADLSAGNAQKFDAASAIFELPEVIRDESNALDGQLEAPETVVPAAKPTAELVAHLTNGQGLTTAAPPADANATAFDRALAQAENAATIPPPDEEARRAFGIAPPVPTAPVPTGTLETAGAANNTPGPNAHVSAEGTTSANQPTGTPAPAPVATAATSAKIDPDTPILWIDGTMKTPREIDGERMLKRDFSKQQHELLQEKRIVDTQKAFLDIAARDTFTSTYLQAVNSGQSQEAAFQGALVASGKAKIENGQIVPLFPVAEKPLELPDDSDPEYLAKFAAYQTQQISKMLDERLAPLKKDAPVPQTQPIPGNAQQHNSDLFKSYIDPYAMQYGNLNDKQKEILVGYIRYIGDQEQVPVDPATFQTKPLSIGDVKTLATKAFPNERLPEYVEQQLRAVASQPQGFVPQTFGGFTPQSLSTSQPHLTAGLPPLPAAAQMQAVQNLLAENQSLKEQLGLVPPRVPQQTAASSGPLPGTDGGAEALPTLRATDRVRNMMGALKYSD